MTTPEISAKYPARAKLPDGTEIDIRLMGRADHGAMVKFAKALPEEDLLFLRLDLTKPEVVDEWIANLESGHSTSLIAADSDGLIGYATVHRNKARWTRGVGEIRINVSAKYRSKGLGRLLTSRIFDIARHEGLRKLMANMIEEQAGAQAAFRRLGFVREALLADYVEDQSGTTRDLVIMSYDVGGHSDQMDEPVRI